MALDPNARFVFLDFKGRTLDDIDFETNYLETKWNKEPSEWRKALEQAQAMMPNTVEGLEKGDPNVIKHFDVAIEGFHLYDGKSFRIQHSCMSNIFSGGE